MKLRTRLLAVATGVAFVISTLAVMPARADDIYFPPDAHPGVYTHPDGILSAFTGWLNSSGAAERGFVVGVRTGELHLTLRWKNLTPRDEARVRSKAKDLGLAVEFTEAPYSHAELNDLKKKVSEIRAAGSLDGYEIIGLSTTSLDSPEPSLQVRRISTGTARTATLKGASSIVADRTGIELRVQDVGDGGVPIPAATTRGTDTPNFNAGGFFSYSRGVCSTGFTYATTYPNEKKASTARHCWGTDYITYDGRYFMSQDPMTTSGDGGGLLVAPGSYAMFTGNNMSSTRRAVSDYADVNLGQSVCVSGGNSGERCGLKVINLVVSWDDSYGPFDNIVAENPTGAMAVMEGDSGGPVFTNLDGTGTGRLGAAGMIQALAYPVACESYRLLGRCGKQVFFSSTRTLARTFGGKLWTVNGALAP